MSNRTIFNECPICGNDVASWDCHCNTYTEIETQQLRENDLQKFYRNYKTPFLRTRAGVICKHLILFVTFQSLGWLFWWFVITMGWKH